MYSFSTFDVTAMLYYLHGYQSSPSGQKAVLFQETVHAIPISYREGLPEDLVISECLSRIHQVIKNDHQVVLIGSSLGGFLAASTALRHQNVRQLILLNPAVIPPEVDLYTIQGMPLRILKEMSDPRLFQERITAAITILRGTQDDVVPEFWIQRFAEAQKATLQCYDDDHRFSNTLHNLPRIIFELLEE